MKYASDFKKIARDALRGNWRTAILTGFVASLIGANLTTSGGIGSGSNSSSTGDTNDFIPSENLENFLPIFLIILAIIVVWLIVTTIISGAGKLGYAKFNLNLIDRKKADFSDLFSQFNRLGDGFCMNLLIGIYIIFWSLLFIIPGIVKSYSYAMTVYILSEHPEATVNEAITESRKIMHGNKWRLFCLEFSFIGWEFLGLASVIVLLPLMFMGTIGIILWLIIALAVIFILSLILNPYKEAARAAFYRDVSGTDIPPSSFTTGDLVDAY